MRDTFRHLLLLLYNASIAFTFLSCVSEYSINLYQDVSTSETASLQTASVIRLQREQSEEHEECQPDLQGSVVTNSEIRLKNRIK